MNLVLSPPLSLQLYTQPLLSAGDYAGIRSSPRRAPTTFPVYGVDVGTVACDPGSAIYTIDPDGAGAARPVPLPDPDFNFKSLRVNTVLRWEWRPGSPPTSSGRSVARTAGIPATSPSAATSAISSRPRDDVFMVKVTWWLGR